MENALHRSPRSMCCASEPGRPTRHRPRRHASPLTPCPGDRADICGAHGLGYGARCPTRGGVGAICQPFSACCAARRFPRPPARRWGARTHGRGARKVTAASDARATPAIREQGVPPRRCLAHVSCVMVEGGSSMPRLQLSLKRRTHEVGRSRSHLPEVRMRPARTQREFGRRPRMPDPPVRRPPYIEAAITAAAFIFLLYLVLGGA